MKRILLSIISLAFFASIIGCSDDAEPQFRIRNELSTKANAQIQTSGGNTINLNDVQGGQTTSYQTASEGNIVATTVIQNEPISPAITFFAAKDASYTIVILKTNPPTLRVDKD